MKRVYNNNKSKKSIRKKGGIFNYGYSPFTTMSAPLRTRPVSFGPGTYCLNVSKLVKGSLTTEVDLNLYYDVIYENPEFLRVKEDFKYFKLLGFSVIFLPRNLPVEGNQTPAYLTVNYDGIPTVNPRLQDNVKIISPFLNRHKIFKFKIPDITASTGSLQSFRNINEINDWNVILLQLIAPDNTTSWFLRIDVRILLKGPSNKAETKNDVIHTDMISSKNRLSKQLTETQELIEEEDKIKDLKLNEAPLLDGTD